VGPRDASPPRRRQPILREGPDHLLWALADDVGDGYFRSRTASGFAIDEIRTSRRARSPGARALFALKRELIEVRRSISPVADLQPAHQPRLAPHRRGPEILYFRDIYDHVIRLTDELGNYRELASAT
jgi:magnesium transporter